MLGVLTHTVADYVKEIKFIWPEMGFRKNLQCVFGTIQCGSMKYVKKVLFRSLEKRIGRKGFELSGLFCY